MGSNTLFVAICLELGGCNPNPCKNSGSCEEKDEGYACVCKDGFTGAHCETGLHQY